MIESTASIAAQDNVPAESPHDRLRRAAEQMEGLFMQHLTSALRATVPGGGNPDAPGADMYASLLDEQLAHTVAEDTSSGIAEALYRQLSGALPAESNEGSSP
ncbi:MAG: rod-binding protein [Gemmatimonadota bacterium]